MSESVFNLKLSLRSVINLLRSCNMTVRPSSGSLTTLATGPQKLRYKYKRRMSHSRITGERPVVQHGPRRQQSQGGARVESSVCLISGVYVVHRSPQASYVEAVTRLTLSVTCSTCQCSSLFLGRNSGKRTGCIGYREKEADDKIVQIKPRWNGKFSAC